jgi:N-methylhydantoinase A
MSDRPCKAAFLGRADVVFDRKVVKTPIIARDKLAGGNKIMGPGIVVEYSATIVIPPFADAFVDGYGNMILEILG